MIEGILCIYGLSVTIIFFTFLVLWIRNYQEVKQYANYGWILGIGIAIFDLSAFLFLPRLRDSSTYALALLGDIFTVLRIALFTVVGIYYCAKLNITSFAWHPVKLKLLVSELPTQSNYEESVTPTEEFRLGSNGEQSTNVGEIPEDVTYLDNTVDTQERVLEDNNEKLEQPSDLKIADDPSHLRNSVLSIMLAVGCAVIYTFLLFWVTKPQIALVERRNVFFGPDADAQNALSLISMMFVIEAAFFEEIFFRLGIQNLLAYLLDWQSNRYWLAIVVTALIWTLGHAAILDPTWVKLIQVFPFGIVLGWLFKKYGIESAIITHGVFNVVILLLNPVFLHF